MDPLEQLEQVPRTDPQRKKPGYWAELAKQYALRSHPDRLEVTLDQFIQRVPKQERAEALRFAVDCYAKADLYPQALATIERLARLSHTRPVPDAQLAMHLELCERNNDLTRGQELVDSLSDRPDRQSRRTQVMAARLCRRVREPEQALGWLDRALAAAPQSQDQDQALAWHERFLVLDLLDQTEEAFTALSRSNELRARDLGQEAIDQTKRRRRRRWDQLDELLETIESKHPDLLHTEPPVKPGRGAQAPVFLLGHPRSGTTLLERILARHPQVVGTDERHAIELAVVEPWLRQTCPQHPPEQTPGSELARLMLDTSRDQIQRWHQAYHKELSAQLGLDPRSKTLVEKNPGFTEIILPLAYLFPNASFLIAHREPREVCWSAYRVWSPGNTAANVFWLGLDDVVESYQRVMALAERSQALLPPSRLIHASYAKLISQPAEEGQRITAAIGLDWQNNQLGPQLGPEANPGQKSSATPKTAHAEPPARSPSYAELTQPVGPAPQPHWMRYAAYLSEPFSPLNSHDKLA